MRVPSRELRIDLAIAAALAAAMVVELLADDGDDTTITPVRLAAIALAALPVLARRRHPVGALVASMATLVLVINVSGIYQAVPGASMVSGYTIAAQRSRREAYIAGAVLVPAVLLILELFSPHGLLTLETVKNLAFVALPLVLGCSAQDRRALVASLVERAETAEQTREEEARRRVGEERLRIAQDVHDVVAHAMVAINVQAGVAAHLLDRDPDQAREALVDIKRVSGEALGDLRATLGMLRDDAAPVRPADALHRVDELAASLRATGVTVEVEVDPALDDPRPLPTAVAAVGYRIVQEALTNVLRHAQSTTAWVRVRRASGVVVIDVADDGRGGGVAVPGGTGNGLRGMRERAQAVGGTVEAGPRDGGGWRVLAHIPAEAEA